MTRPTLDKSLAALAAELRDLDRKGRMAALQAASARSAARASVSPAVWRTTRASS